MSDLRTSVCYKQHVSIQVFCELGAWLGKCSKQWFVQPGELPWATCKNSLICSIPFVIFLCIQNSHRIYYSGKEIEIFTLVRIFVLYYPSIVFQMTIPPAGYEKVKWGPQQMRLVCQGTNQSSGIMYKLVTSNLIFVNHAVSMNCHQ